MNLVNHMQTRKLHQIQVKKEKNGKKVKKGKAMAQTDSEAVIQLPADKKVITKEKKKDKVCFSH